MASYIPLKQRFSREKPGDPPGPPEGRGTQRAPSLRKTAYLTAFKRPGAMSASPGPASSIQRAAPGCAYSFFFFTSIVTVATLLSSEPSFALKVNVSVPVNLRFGV